MRLSNDQLQAEAREFALIQESVDHRVSYRKFWSQFHEDLRSLTLFSERLAHTRVECSQPAEEWLLDHIAFLRTQGQEVLRALPSGTLRQLPQLRSSGHPRAYALADHYLSHTDGRYATDTCEAYVMAYQEVSGLTTTECWILPSVLRMAMIRHLAAVMREVRHRHEVCERSTQLLEDLRQHAANPEDVRRLLKHRSERSPLSPVEVVHLVQHLTEHQPHVGAIRQWLSLLIEQNESNLDHLTSLEHQFQSDLQVTAGDLVTSLHGLERQPWLKTFGRICMVETIFRSDPASGYQEMDFASQDLLRQRTVHLAHRLKTPDIQVAKTAVNLARQKRVQGEDSDVPRQAFPAFYLLEHEGIAQLSAALGLSLNRNPLRRRPFTTYLVNEVLIFLSLLLVAAYLAMVDRHPGPFGQMAVLLALAIPLSQWTTTIVHSAIQHYTSPKILLRYDFSDHVPRDSKTLVVIPVIWSSPEDVDDVFQRLLVHYLANRQSNLYFAVLGDFEDHAQASTPMDSALLDYAIEQVHRLQQEYGGDRFFLLHRQRQYDAVDQIYMGWERKRGKLVELVELLKGSRETSFTTVVGSTPVLSQIRYVLTVDHDTKLPIGAVSRLVGTIHFPYNRARLNQEGTRVIEGFGIVQPRVTVSYESTQRSRFAALWAGEPGIDPYAFAISDPYQDLFGQSSFSGKGIFDVDVFHAILADRIPEHLVLSHDLLEGGFLRTGLAPDIEFVEDHPRSFYSHQLRADRWTRGDWQLIKWLGPHLKNRHGIRQSVDLGGLTRLQIVDNMRRSLLEPSLFFLALLGASVLPGREELYEWIVLLTVFLPFFDTLKHPLRRRHRIVIIFLQNAVQLITLPFRATATLVAIVRTLYRLLITRRHLLQWTPGMKSDQIRRSPVLLHESVGYVAIALFFVLAWAFRPREAFVWGTILPALWLIARPLIVQLNAPEKPRLPSLTSLEREQLLTWAKQIWAFFDHYVTAEDSWLPPDNVQYYPRETVAHRTSPTNIGLYLAALMTAHDLGLLDMDTALFRLEATLTTLTTLEKWHGHLYNWYDTRTGDPLAPAYVSTVDSGNLITYLVLLRQGLRIWASATPEQSKRIQALTKYIHRLIAGTDFQALYDADARLFCLGVHTESNRRELALYDLLASEARQTSFIAIALGQVPVSHWFTLGRTMTIAGGQKTLVSWSGTMFEYLLPGLVLRTYRNTIWDSTYQGVVVQQKAYAFLKKIPFGISESGYFAFDYQLNYQYHAFGVPGLGMARGLDQNLVTTPYATMLALPFTPKAAIAALGECQTLGAKGPYGFYEAIDFTPKRIPEGASHEVIQSFMAHHQAMSLLAIGNGLTDNLLVERFHQDPEVRAAELLLQERVPAEPALLSMPVDIRQAPDLEGERTGAVHARRLKVPLAIPQVNIISNGRMSSIVSDDGQSQLVWNHLQINRWQDDALLSQAGLAIYFRDLDGLETWSATPFPMGKPSQVNATFRLDRTGFSGKKSQLEWELDITVHPEVDAEVRRLRITNQSGRERNIEITTFQDLALANQRDDRAHLAYSKLFIETRYDAKRQCLLAHRRPRSEGERDVWAAYSLNGQAPSRRPKDVPSEFDSDRARFIGRGRDLEHPRGLDVPLSETTGAVMDPAFVMRSTLHLDPGETLSCYLVTTAAPSEAEVLALVDQLNQADQADRAFHLAWIRTQIDLRHQHLSAEEARDAQWLAGRLMLSAPLSAFRKAAIIENVLPASAVWRLGLSPDRPMMVVHIRHPADLPFVSRLLRWHQYLVSTLALEVEAVVLNDCDEPAQLIERLHADMAAKGISTHHLTEVSGSQMSAQELTLITALAKVFLEASGPSPTAQLGLNDKTPAQILPLEQPVDNDLTQDRAGSGEYDNGYGGFVADGQAYAIRVLPSTRLPRPWSNILANPEFGCLVTELGFGYTWWRNAREFKLTPWSNDPVSDPPGESLYLRDLESGEVWSPTPLPAGGRLNFTVTHGLGFSRFESKKGALTQTMEVTVPPADSVKLVHLRVENSGSRPRRLAVTYCATWVLGVQPQDESPFVVSRWDQDSETLMASNRRQEAFAGSLAFVHMVRPDNHTAKMDYTGNGSQFFGRTGRRAYPHALAGDRLSQETGAFASALGAVQTVIEVPARGEISLLVLVGAAASQSEALDIVHRYASANCYAVAKKEVTTFWEKTTTAIQVKTPDRAMDILLNGWLIYQALACRLWARTAFYQAGGAYGFRDQLQDSLALMHTDPSYARMQILRCAAHQYREGDVEHWWHDEIQKGIRTKISDDLLWLPYAVARYLEHTEDQTLLEEEVPFLVSPELREQEEDRFEDIRISDERGTVLEHCLRAIDRACRFGQHGLPLMGAGDWNDGMSHVGVKGRGESVWLGWFLLTVLDQFLDLPHLPISESRREGWIRVRDSLYQSLNQFAWDGQWFRRAFTDDGVWLGSDSGGLECRIDAIAQSWSVLSRGSTPQRQEEAMQSFDRMLVDRRWRLARLLTPPFDTTKPSPGYIQGYPPGIRENGGQYTHGVIWGIIAWAMLGHQEKAFALFDLLNPITHTKTPEDVLIYGNEPYVMSADVYTADPYCGRAGWSWYTGAAGWMYQAGIEHILGIRRRGNRLYLAPVVPPEWTEFTVHYRFHSSTYQIAVHIESEPSGWEWVVDGGPVTRDPFLTLGDDRKRHSVTVRLGRAQAERLSNPSDDEVAVGASLSQSSTDAHLDR